MLGPSLEALVDAGAPENPLRAIIVSLWTEFVVPYMNGVQEPEPRYFWEALEAEAPGLAREAREIHSLNREASVREANMKARIMQASRTFFSLPLEVSIIRPLAMKLGYIPGDVDVFSLSDTERADLAHLQAD